MMVVPNLSWARAEVLDLVADLASADAEVGARAVDRLSRLSRAAADPGRRMALLVQLSAALAGTLTIADSSPNGLDRRTLREDLSHLVRGALHDVPMAPPSLN
ncbi:MAG: hypothetical protein OEY23_09440 [Acidimicrobiia bacterium]|nr:hypothetical protein [Acidimicrobiia bacterium]